MMSDRPPDLPNLVAWLWPPEQVRVLTRAAVVAERLWSGTPSPIDVARQRLATARCRLVQQRGLHASPVIPDYCEPASLGSARRYADGALTAAAHAIPVPTVHDDASDAVSAAAYSSAAASNVAASNAASSNAASNAASNTDSATIDSDEAYRALLVAKLSAGQLTGVRDCADGTAGLALLLGSPPVLASLALGNLLALALAFGLGWRLGLGVGGQRRPESYVSAPKKRE